MMWIVILSILLGWNLAKMAEGNFDMGGVENLRIAYVILTPLLISFFVWDKRSW